MGYIANLRYPTPFVFKWSSRVTLLERRGQPVRQINFDQNGMALFEFEDGIQVLSSQNSVKWLDEETRQKYIFKDKKAKKRFKTPEKIARMKREKEAYMNQAEETGADIIVRAHQLSAGRVPPEVFAAVQYSAGLKKMTGTAWVYEAVMEKIERELFTPDTPDKMAMKHHKPAGLAKGESKLRLQNEE